MSEQKKSRLSQMVTGGLAILAAAAGIYWFQGEGRKAGPEIAAASTAANPASRVTKELATGALAAFLVKKERKAVPDIAFQDGTGQPQHRANRRALGGVGGFLFTEQQQTSRFAVV